MRLFPRLGRVKFVFSAAVVLLASGCGSSTQDYTKLPSAALPNESQLPYSNSGNLLCTAGDSSTPYVLERAFAGVEFTNPVRMVQVPGDSSSPFYVLEKAGRVMYVPAPDTSDSVVSQIALQINVNDDFESGATGIAFHPEYASNGRVFITYGADGSSSEYEFRLSEFHRAADGIGLESEKILITIPKDGPLHFGGDIAFGPDGYLYMGIGDDGNNHSGDPRAQRAQDPSNLYGTVLRIDIDKESENKGYTIPNDNPAFFNRPANEVWAYGFRNPWTLSFDAFAPDGLWVGNVGWFRFEEIDFVEKGGNHGWPDCEGNCDVPSPDIQDPLYSYPHTDGASVVGGYVYRGNEIPELYGKFIFADYIDQVVQVLDTELIPGDPNRVKSIITGIPGIASFAQANDLELYAVSYSNHTIYKLVRGLVETAVEPPGKLSQTGCFAFLRDGKPIANEGAHEYHVAQRFWSDDAKKSRLVAIPDNQVINNTDPDNWILPSGGVTIKHFYLNDEIIETRFFVRYNDGTYGGYTYEWNDSKSDAVLVEADGKRKVINNQEWYYPSRSDCFRCHTEEAGYNLSLETRQLNIDLNLEKHQYQGSQLDRLNELTLIDSSSEDSVSHYTLHKDLDNKSLDLTARVKSYLHVNCASCHRGAGSTGRASWDARFTTAIGNMGVCNSEPLELTNIVLDPAEKIILPGDHSLSSAWLRMMERNSPNAMPPVATSLIDQTGTNLLQEWISEMDQDCQ